MLFRLAYLGVINTIALLRLLPTSDVDKNAEILALRHQIAVLERQLHGEKVRFTWADRAWLAALLQQVPREVLRSVRLLVRPETVLRWHRDLIARRHAMISRPTRVGRPPTVRSIRRLVLRLASENNTWGTAESMANYSSSVSRSPPPPSGRSSRTPASTRHHSAPAPPGRRSCAPKPRPSSPPTSSKP